jgi:hypothetical protein
MKKRPTPAQLNQQVEKEYHEWNGDPEEFNPRFLALHDYAVMSFLAHKLLEMGKQQHLKEQE